MNLAKKVPVVLQAEISECGLVCLAMILMHHGLADSLSQVQAYAETSLKGMTVSQLRSLAEKCGFDASVLRLEPEQLGTVPVPFIAHWNMNHFVVVTKIKGDTIFYNDPAVGQCRLSFAEASQYFTGIVLELLRSAAIIKLPPVNSRHALTLKGLFYRYKIPLLAILTVSLLIQACYMLGIKLMQYSIDACLHMNSSNHLVATCLLFLSLKFLEIIADGIRISIIALFGARLNKQVANHVMNHMLDLPLSFFQNRFLGDILSRFNSIDKIRNSLTEGTITKCVDILFATTTASMMMFYSAKMSSIVLLIALTHQLTHFIYHKNLRLLNEKSLYNRALESSIFVETLKAMSAIKLFSKEKLRLNTWRNKYISYLNSLLSITKHKAYFDIFKNALHAIDLAIVLLLGCFFVNKQEISIGGLYAFLAYRQQFMTAVNGFAEKNLEYRSLKFHLNKVNDVLNIKPIKQPLELIHASHYDMRVENVSFAYPNEDRELIKNINLHIHPGEVIAITGPSGCGKTTLLKIMMGMLQPTAGKITLACTQNQIAGVLQEDILLSGSIADNIAFFDPNADHARIREAANLAGIYDEVNNFPMGLHTLIGDMGSVLSGGQKQRVLLARALYAQPKVLFLDEASSHLDYKKEQEVNENLRQLKITTIMVAHRQETIKMADRIFSLGT